MTGEKPNQHSTEVARNAEIMGKTGPGDATGTLKGLSDLGFCGRRDSNQRPSHLFDGKATLAALRSLADLLVLSGEAHVP